MALDQLLDEAFPTEKPSPAEPSAPRGGSLDSLLDEAFGEAPPKPAQPGLLSRAASAATSAVTGLLSGGGASLGLKAAGPAIAPGAAAPPKSVTLPQAPSEEDLKATRSSAAIPEPKASAPPPVPIKIGPVPVLAPVVEEARRAPLLEQVAGGPVPSDVFKPPQEPQGMLARGATAAGLVSPEAAAQRRREAEFAATSVMQKPEGMSEERWQVRQALDTLNRTTAALPRATADRLTFGVLPALLDTFGIESPKTRAPQSQPEALATGAGELAGFLMGPARASHAMLEGNILKWIGPKAGDAVGTILAKNVATQVANLGIASGLAHLGEEAQADNLVDAYREMGQHVKGGAMLGAAFGGVGGIIPGNTLLSRAARLGVGLAVIDVVQGTHPLDERALAQKAFDYGLNIAFLWRGQDPQQMQALLAAEAKARSTKDKPVTPEQVLKSALDKAQERAVTATSPEERATLEADLKSLFAQEVGDVATGTTATELRSAREVAEEKTGGPAGPGKPAPAPMPAEPAITLPGGQPGPQTGPVMILGPTGRPMAAVRPATPPEAPEPLQTAQERAEARAKGVGRPAAPRPQGAAPAFTVKPETADRPVAGLSFKDYVEFSGKRWPLTSRDPDFARLRFEFDDMKKGLYEARPGQGGQWAIVNRKTGEEVDHLVGGAKAQLEANRLNAVVTLDAFRSAQVPGPIRMEVPMPGGPRPAPVEFQGLQETGAGKPPMELWGLTQDISGYPKGSTVGRSTLEALGFTVPKVPAEARVGVRPRDLSAEKAPEPKVEGSAAVRQQAERAAIEGPKPSAEPPAPASVPAPPPRPVLIGKQQEIRVPAGSRYQVEYEVIPAEDLIPSHDPQTFAKNPQYPEGVQNRPYHSDKSEQAKVIRQGQDFEPLFLVSPQPSSGGTPIVAPDSNVVLSGNSRTMSLLRTLETEAFDRYRKALEEMAPALGIKAEDLATIKNPVLVRRLVGTDTTPEFYRRFAKETNEGFKKPPKPDEEYATAPAARSAEAEAPYRPGESGVPSGAKPRDSSSASERRGPPIPQSPIRGPETQAESSGSQRWVTEPPSGSDSLRTSVPSQSVMPSRPFGAAMARTSTPSLRQPVTGVNELRRLAVDHQPLIQSGLQDLIREVPGAALLGSRVKDLKSLEGKVTRKNGNADTITDYLGFRISVDSQDALDALQRSLGQRYRIAKVDDMLAQPSPLGYRAMHLDMRAADGFIFEVQVIPTEVARFQGLKPGGGHDLYKRWQSLQDLGQRSAEQDRELADVALRSNIAYQAAYDAWREGDRRAQEQKQPIETDGPSTMRLEEMARRTPVPLEQELAELFAIRGGSEGPAEPPTPQSAPPSLVTETREKLVKYGHMVFAESPARSYPDFARRITEKLGDRVRPYLPDVWAEVLREAARTQRPLPGGQKGGKPPAPPADIPQSAKPIEPAPGLTEPQLKLGVHKDVLAAAEDLFRMGKLVRDPKMLLSDQILDAIREGSLRIEEMAGILDKHGMTFTEFGQSMFRPAITDAARRLAALSTLQKRIRDLEVDLGGPAPKGGKPGGPGEGERLEKVKTLGDLLDAAKAIDPAAVRALSWWRRADNIRRGLLVTQLATSVRNFTTQVGRLGMDVLDQGLQGALQRAFGKEITTHPADSFRALMEALSQARPSKHKAVKDKVDAILEGLPREQERLFGTYASDLTTAAKKQGAEGAIDAGFRGGERAVELLNTVNRFQEYVVRRSVFQAELAARLRARGIDLEEAIAKPEVRRQIPVADIRAAIQKSLEITFAENPAYGSPGYHFVKWVNQTPGLTFLTPFPRFMVNSLKFFYEFSPLGFTKLLSEVERQKFRQGDMQTISRATLGLGLLGTAYLIRAMQEDDTKWYEVRLPGMTRTLDTRAYNPFAAYLFVADLIHRSAQSRLYGGGLTAEAVKTFLGANVRGGTGLQAVDQLVDGLRDIGDTRALEKYLKGAGGHLISGFLTPLQQLTDVYAEFSPDDQVVRDVKSEPFLGPIKQRFPSTMVEAAGGALAEEKASPTSEEPVRRESPGLRQAFGLTFGKEKNDLEKELDRLQIPYREVLPSQGDPRLDNILARHMGERAEIGNRLVNSSRYQHLGEIAKRLELKDYLRRLRKQAKVKALQDREYREIAREVKAGTSKERLAELAREERAGLR